MNQKKQARYKAQWHLVDFKALEPMVKAIEHGNTKYEPNDWKTKYTKKQLIDKIQRHLVAIIDGEEIDPESKIPHIGHLLADAMFYSHFLRCSNNQISDFSNNESISTDKEMD
jgi:hypothetical protein